MTTTVVACRVARRPKPAVSPQHHENDDLLEQRLRLAVEVEKALTFVHMTGKRPIFQSQDAWRLAQEGIYRSGMRFCVRPEYSDWIERRPAVRKLFEMSSVEDESGSGWYINPRQKHPLLGICLLRDAPAKSRVGLFRPRPPIAMAILRYTGEITNEKMITRRRFGAGIP